jgi:hypothetical protein
MIKGSEGTMEGILEEQEQKAEVQTIIKLQVC